MPDLSGERGLELVLDVQDAGRQRKVRLQQARGLVRGHNAAEEFGLLL